MPETPVPSAATEASLETRVEAMIFEVTLGNRDEQPVAAQVIALVRAEVACEIEREQDPGAGFADIWNQAIKRCVRVALGESR